jgi:hypothetical protein
MNVLVCVSQHRCRLVDYDIFGNEQRPYFDVVRNGAVSGGCAHGALGAVETLGLTLAGTSIRYRRRIAPLEKYEIRTKIATGTTGLSTSNRACSRCRANVPAMYFAQPWSQGPRSSD